ncbi:SDR family oxidoreductase [Rathayibacter sp. VKM Ac-2754]|uniref:SDR family oxidoreductase n=1 Tax=Rathayibacter sp. VKM Ac-2754 TaxID=2609251 RepID=UPI0013591E8A|nr:SDR family oxidoreductase [Rathayibacter sp. VKM Ac-2754]MWV57709.1 SDR family NAD(P)-dependent oxidoreductase [Rathayibacter sp. VKM Ac-2754]
MPALTGAVVLVTGANGGLGSEFVAQALARGASKVYAAARRPKEWGDERIVPLVLDVNDAASIAAAVEAAPDVTVLVNNAGVSGASYSLLALSAEELRAVMETNFFGPVLLAKAFASRLATADGAAIVDVHSALSWFAVAGGYSASKAALWSATNSLRLELAPQGVHVLGLHVGYVDTPMAAGADGPKASPADVVGQTYDGLEAGAFEVLADDTSRQVKSGLSAPLEAVYPQLAV